MLFLLFFVLGFLSFFIIRGKIGQVDSEFSVSFLILGHDTF